MWVRRAVFETNSSSTHALVVEPGEARLTSLSPEALREGKITIPFDRNFYQKWERFYRPENKIKYVFSQLIRNVDFSDIDLEVTQEVILERAPKIVEFKQAIEDFTGCEVVLEFHRIPGFDGAYGVATEYASMGEFIDFAFNDASYIEVGNDNNRAPEIMPSDKGDIVTYDGLFVEDYDDSNACYLAFKASSSFHGELTFAQKRGVKGSAEQSISIKSSKSVAGASSYSIADLIEGVEGAVISDVFYQPDGAVGDRWLRGNPKVNERVALIEMAVYGDKTFRTKISNTAAEKSPPNRDRYARGYFDGSVAIKVSGSDNAVQEIAQRFDDLKAQLALKMKRS